MSRGTNISKCLNCGEEFLCGDCIDSYCPKCKRKGTAITPIAQILHAKNQEIATLKTEIGDEIRRHTETGRLYNDLFIKHDKLVKEHENTIQAWNTDCRRILETEEKLEQCKSESLTHVREAKQYAKINRKLLDELEELKVENDYHKKNVDGWVKKYDELYDKMELSKKMYAELTDKNTSNLSELEYKRDIIDKFINAVERGDFESEIGIHYNQFKKDMGYDKKGVDK